MSPITPCAVFCVLFALVEVGSCLDCFHCNSQTDKKCGEPFMSTVKALKCGTEDSDTYKRVNLYNLLPSEIFTGGSDPQKCYKLVMGTGTVVRTCLEGKNANAVCNLAKLSETDTLPGKRVTSCLACEKDGCNGAGALSFSLPLSVLTIFVSYLLYKQ